MDQEFLENNKVLVINQLSARLPFGVMVAVHYEGIDRIDDFTPSDFTGRLVGIECSTVVKIFVRLSNGAWRGLYIKLKKKNKTEKTPVRQPDEIFPAGTRVMKKSGKKFLSKSTVNTVKDVVEHPYKKDPETGVGVPAYTFVEDDSVVECATCVKSEE